MPRKLAPHKGWQLAKLTDGGDRPLDVTLYDYPSPNEVKNPGDVSHIGNSTTPYLYSGWFFAPRRKKGQWKTIVIHSLTGDPIITWLKRASFSSKEKAYAWIKTSMGQQRARYKRWD